MSERSMVRVIANSPDNPKLHLEELRAIVAERIDATDSARETGTLARVILDIESALRSLKGAGKVSPVDDLLKRRAARGAK